MRAGPHITEAQRGLSELRLRQLPGGSPARGFTNASSTATCRRLPWGRGSVSESLRVTSHAGAF